MSERDKVMHWWGIYLRGVAMGAADVVPGVSGGTIAFISGIYERLIMALGSVDITLLGLLARGRIAEAWRRVDATFLIQLVAGILTSVALFARLLRWLLTEHPVPVWSFFFGLIVASTIILFRRLEAWRAREIGFAVVGAALAVWIATVRPATVDAGPWYLLMSGALAICAMILPGISGSFILVLLGAYGQVLAAVGNFDIGLLAWFVVGCGAGLLSFVQLLRWLLRHYHDRVLALLTGFLAGSLYLVWPWKEVTQYYHTHSGELRPLVEHNVSPWQYAAATGGDHLLVPALLLALAGVVLVLLFERLAAPEAH